MATYKGQLFDYFETGTEGVVWTLVRDGATKAEQDRREDLVFLKNGDWLKAFDAKGRVLFDGVIQEDRKAGWTEYPRNPGHGQPSALGFWIHWTQTGWTPDDWARLFIGRKQALRAELTRDEPPAEPSPGKDGGKTRRTRAAPKRRRAS